MTPTAPAPRFERRPGHPALRALAILGLSAALTGGFLAHALRAPPTAPAAGPADDAALVHCTPDARTGHC